MWRTDTHKHVYNCSYKREIRSKHACWPVVWPCLLKCPTAACGAICGSTTATSLQSEERHYFNLSPSYLTHTGLTHHSSTEAAPVPRLPLQSREPSFKGGPKETSRTASKQAETPDPKKDVLSRVLKKINKKNNRRQQQSRHEAMCLTCNWITGLKSSSSSVVKAPFLILLNVSCLI